jgi:bifunctional non-homologous end joining protein LigD
MPTLLRFIEPCLLSPADRPPSGANWIHEIKHDGYRLMARRDPVGVRLITRRGNDWSARFPLVVEAVNHLKVRSCLIDGEVVCCDERGLARFDVLRRRRNEPEAFLYAFDLLELDGTDLRREPIEVRKATLANILRKSRPGVRLNEHLDHDCGLTVFQRPARWGWRGSSRSDSVRATVRADRAEVQESRGACGKEGGRGGMATIEQRLFYVRRHTREDGSSEWYVLNGHTRRRVTGTFKTQAAAEAQRAKLQTKHDQTYATAMQKLARRWQL